MTTLTTFEQFKAFENICNLICDKPNIRFCGVINSVGRLIVESIKNSVQLLDNEQQRQLLCMQSKLELSMKNEFDDSLGNVNCIATYRDNIVIINIPTTNKQHHILLSAERIVNVTEIVNYVTKLFEKHVFLDIHTHKQFENKIAKTKQISKPC